MSVPAIYAPFAIMRAARKRRAKAAVRRKKKALLASVVLPRTVTQTVSHRVSLLQTQTPLAPVIVSGVPRAKAMCFARSPDGNVYMATGLTPIYKWDGVSYTASTVGVSPPTSAPSVTGSGTGSITGTYSAYLRFLDADGNPSNLSPVSDSLTVDSVSTFTYTGVEAPTEMKAVRKQLLRNTTGQALVYYVDVDSTDLSATSFTSTLTDTQLALNTPVALFDDQGNSLANRFGVPPDDKPVICSYLDRMFAAGEVQYGDGNVQVTTASTTVTGIGTQWTSSFAGRFLYVVGTGRSYEISSVDAAAQTLTLTEAYAGGTDPFAVYVIRPSPAARRTLQFSEAGLYEAWPAANGLTVEENGDSITGLMVADSFLWVLQRRHVYRLTYHLGPLVDGGLFLSARRGCVNNRCWVYVDGASYLLDEQGVYSLSGGGESENVSQAIQDLFYLNSTDAAYRVNWAASEWFHALHCRDERTIRWYVALGGHRLPMHALCYNYDAQAWWVEKYAFPVGHSTVTDSALPRPVVCGPARRVFAQGVGSLDGPDPEQGTTRATASSAGVLSLVAPATASFASTRLAGSPVSIVSGRGKAQTNVVASVSGTTVYLARPWLVKPDSTSKFQLGGVTWSWKTGLMRWANVEGDVQRRVTLSFPPAPEEAYLDLRVFRDYKATPEVYGSDQPSTPTKADAVQVTAGSADAVFSLQNQYGFGHVLLGNKRGPRSLKWDLFAVELRGVTSEGAVVVHELAVEGALPQ